MNTESLVLYQYDFCPFCVKVRNFLNRNNITIPMKDTLQDPAAREELVRLGGKSQVPALLIDGEVLYESNDIIRWVQENVIN